MIMIFQAAQHQQPGDQEDADLPPGRRPLCPWLSLQGPGGNILLNIREKSFGKESLSDQY